MYVCVYVAMDCLVGILGSHSLIKEGSHLLICDTLSLFRWSLMFRRTMVPLEGQRSASRTNVFDSLTLKVTELGSIKVSGTTNLVSHHRQP